MLIVLGLVLSQIVVSMAVKRDSGTAKALMVSQRNVAMFHVESSHTVLLYRGVRYGNIFQIKKFTFFL